MMFLAVFRRLWQAMRRGWADPVFRSLLIMTVTLLFGGALLFHRVEGWTYFQSLYFSVITLTTVGYGDFSPVTFVGRLFTIFYVLVGVGIIVALVGRIATNAAEARVERLERRRDRRAGRDGA
jgi:voltage-gated potassium channel Kch